MLNYVYSLRDEPENSFKKSVFFYPCQEDAGVVLRSGNTSRIPNSSFISVLLCRIYNLYN